MLEVATYLVFCALIDLLGSHRRLGFSGMFSVKRATAPLLTIPVLVLTGQSAASVQRRGS